MDDELGATWQPLSPALLTVRRITCCLVALVLGCALVSVLAITHGLAAACVGGGLIGVALVGALVAVNRRWVAWGWAERADDLLVRRGC